jgi:cytochrome P450
MQVFMDFEHAIFSRRGGVTDPAEVARRQQEAGARMYDYLHHELELDARVDAGDPGEGLFAGFLCAEVDGRRLTRENILDIVYLLIIAGLGTVTSTLLLISAWLAQHPVERQRVVEDATVIPSAIEEIMRWESPVLAGARFATHDVVLPGGEVIPGATPVTAMWACANFDPDTFPDPEVVDFDRPVKNTSRSRAAFTAVPAHA